MLTYEQSGVNIDEGNRAVSLIKGKIKETYDKNVIGDLGNFSGLYSLKDFMKMEEPVLLAATDGVGTKLKLAQIFLIIGLIIGIILDIGIFVDKFYYFM